MPYRFCPKCDRWLGINEYTVNEQGETICPEHKATHGFISGQRNERELRRSAVIGEQEIKRAREQGLL